MSMVFLIPRNFLRQKKIRFLSYNILLLYIIIINLSRSAASKICMQLILEEIAIEFLINFTLYLRVYIVFKLYDFNHHSFLNKRSSYEL